MFSIIKKISFYIQKKLLYICKNNNMKPSALEIANKIILNTDIEKGDVMTNLKLQKLLYYVQGFNLAIFGEELFDESISAWQYGPVVPNVYHEFKGYGFNAIIFNEGNTPEEIILEEEKEDIFHQVLREYGKYSAIQLMNMTHNEDPWKVTKLTEKIDNEIIKKYFQTLVNE